MANHSSTDQRGTYEKYGLNPDQIPAHIAIIMDGNGRWAKKRLLPRTFGHKQGAEAVRRTIKACVELDVRYLSLYTFSTENWRRPEQEVSFLMGLFKELIKRELPELDQNGVRLRCLGAREELSPDVMDSIRFAEEKTAGNTKLNLNLMLNYGSRREITEAMNALIPQIKSGEITAITEELISNHLYTAGMPDPDILIRTSSEIRLSNYMLWQLAYSEFFFVSTLWPEFSKKHLIKLIQDFQNRGRRFGGVTDGITEVGSSEDGSTS